MKHLPKYVTLAALLGLLAFGLYGCITPANTQRAADAQSAFDAERVKIANDLATAKITAAEAQKRMEDAIKALGDELKATAKDVENQTKGIDWEQILGLGLSSLLTFGATNLHRNAREAKVWGTPEAPKT